MVSGGQRQVTPTSHWWLPKIIIHFNPTISSYCYDKIQRQKPNKRGGKNSPTYYWSSDGGGLDERFSNKMFRNASILDVKVSLQHPFLSSILRLLWLKPNPTGSLATSLPIILELGHSWLYSVEQNLCSTKLLLEPCHMLAKIRNSNLE